MVFLCELENQKTASKCQKVHYKSAFLAESLDLENDFLHLHIEVVKMPLKNNVVPVSSSPPQIGLISFCSVFVGSTSNSRITVIVNLAAEDKRPDARKLPFTTEVPLKYFTMTLFCMLCHFCQSFINNITFRVVELSDDDLEFVLALSTSLLVLTKGVPFLITSLLVLTEISLRMSVLLQQNNQKLLTYMTGKIGPSQKNR